MLKFLVRILIIGLAFYHTYKISKLYFSYDYTIKISHTKEASLDFVLYLDINEIDFQQILWQKIAANSTFKELLKFQDKSNYTGFRNLYTQYLTDYPNEFMQLIRVDGYIKFTSKFQSMKSIVRGKYGFKLRFVTYVKIEKDNSDMFSMRLSYPSTVANLIGMKIYENVSQFPATFTDCCLKLVGNMLYLYKLKIKYFKRLPYPFNSNCHSYGKSLRYRQMCMKSCLQRINSREEISICYNQECPSEDCFIGYPYLSLHRKIPTNENWIILKIYLDPTVPITTYTEQPKVELFNYLVDLGSILSFWFGFSFLTSGIQLVDITKTRKSPKICINLNSKNIICRRHTDTIREIARASTPRSSTENVD